MTKQSERRPYRRERRYDAAFTVALSADQRSALDAEADAAGRPVSAVARDAIERGLPLLKDSRRKRARQAARQRSGNGGAV